MYVKDILEFLDKDENFEWQKLIRKNVLFVPESKKIDELLREFQVKKMHMAIIVDEYGGSAEMCIRDSNKIVAARIVVATIPPKDLRENIIPAKTVVQPIYIMDS